MTLRGERLLGEVVGGKYRICRFLASGGMGAVYEAQHTLVKRRFAVKFLHPDLARKRDLLARFQREAEAAGALESENVAASVDLGIAGDGSPYIVMEYLVGESLELLLEREGTLPVERAADLVQQACRGVQAAHALGIVHRDLKPHNLFVCRREDGTDLLKVLDFGIAKLEVVEQNSAATRTGTVLGTPSYMAPEQARGERSVGHAADVYALGAILYELLSGRKPHPGESHNAILHHIATLPAVPLASVKEGLPEELVALVERTLGAHAADRPASADELGQALTPWASRKTWPAPKADVSAPRQVEPSSTLLAPGAPGEPLSPAPSLAVAAVDRERDATRGSRPPALFLVLAAAAAAAAIAIAVASGRPSRPPEPAPAPPRANAPSLPLGPPAPAPVAAEPPQPPAPVSSPRVSRAPAPSAVSAVRPPVASPPIARSKKAPSGDAPASAAPAKAAEPVEASAAPVTFDQKNPYH